MVARGGQSELRVCTQFGNNVKFVVELPNLKDAEPVLLSNVFAIVKVSQIFTVTTLEAAIS